MSGIGETAQNDEKGLLKMEDDVRVEPRGDYVNLDDYEEVTSILGSAVLKLWDAVDDLTRLRPKSTQNYHVTIFGSSRTKPGTQLYQDIRRLASELAKMGCYVITGGGPGLMQAANEGASAGAPDHPERSIGIRVLLPFEQTTNTFVGKVYQHKTFFSRLHHFVLQSNAYIVTSGGIGTTLELMMIWQLLQVRRLYNTPLLLLGDMWPDLVAWARTYMVERNLFADPLHVDIPQCTGSVEQAISIIGERYRKWQQERDATVEA